jgi:hypothetical protein
MKSPICILLAALLSAPQASMAAAAPHDHHAAAPQTMTLNAGKKWATDLPLQQGMNAIRSAASAILLQAHAGMASTADYDRFAGEVTTQVDYIVQHCKLEPRADAQLHIVIGAIMAGVAMAEGKQVDASRSAGVVRVAQALNTYGTYFNHPHWKRLALAH